MLWRAWNNDLASALAQSLSTWGQILAPSFGADGLVRLLPIDSASVPDFSVKLPHLPLKKWLIPPRELLWRETAESCDSSTVAELLVVIGVAPCDLYALDYLDQTWHADAGYCRRRERLLVVGGSCTPQEGCCCPSRSAPPPFDLLLDGDRIWSGSGRGDSILSALEGDSGPKVEPFSTTASWRDGSVPELPTGLEEAFAISRSEPFWAETARRCLGCGVCSVVCPTCACFDLVDSPLLDGSAERYRTWDNCFFRSHGLVAGGHNFRCSRSERLQFRFEHKLLGFGTQRGNPGCVGCGRCTAACPVGIDLQGLLAAVTSGGER